MKITKNKNQYFSFLKESLSKFVVVLVVFSMLASVLNINQTYAYFSDAETSAGNTFTAGTLAFHLNPSTFTFSVLAKGGTASYSTTLANDESLGFQYTVATTDTTGDLCNALTLQAANGAYTYNGTLAEFSAPARSYEASAWNFIVTLPSGAADTLQDKTCNFKFTFNGWQEGLSSTEGFSDTKQINGTVTSGHWVVPTEPVDDNISPLADSYVKEDSGGNDNYGNNGDLIIRSEDNKNERAFVRFDFHLPTGVIVSSSSLKLYMRDAPSSSRNYEIKSVLSSWVEGIINWNNQPSFSSTPTDIISSGTTNHQWKSWDVKDDVQAIVDGTSNNGWLLKDSDENSSSNYEAKFNSSENNENNSSNKPILEITFSAPPATTDYLVINEVYYKGDNKKEWVELYNPTSSDVNLSGWKLCDNTSCDTIGSYTITSHGFAVIVTSDSEFDRNWVLPSGAVKIVLEDNTIGNGLADDGDRVILKNVSGDTTYNNTTGVVDKMSYGDDTTYMTLPDSGSGKSLARIIKGYDSDLADDWIINATPNPGTNPGSDGEEIIRFTSDGIEIARVEDGLEPLPIITDIEEEVVTPEENLIETLAELITPEEVVEEETTAEIVPDELLPSASLPEEIAPATEEIITEEIPAEETVVPEEVIIKEIPDEEIVVVEEVVVNDEVTE